MKKVITTTTDNLEGYTIKEYKQPISANVVVGTNVFSDISASFSDFFGGRSSSYEDKLSSIYKQSLEKLKTQASSTGANAIVGIRVGTNEVSGGGKQMFMITVTGTPVIINKVGDFSDKAEDLKIVNSSLVNSYIADKALSEKINNENYSLNEEDVRLILNSKSGILTNSVFSLLHKHKITDDIAKPLLEYFNNLTEDSYVEDLYKELLFAGTDMFAFNAAKIIKTYNLVDYDRSAELLKNENENIKYAGLSILEGGKRYYTREDIDRVNEIISEIEKSFPVKVESVTIKKGLFSSETEEAWKCQCGAKNVMKYSKCPQCNRGKYGLSINAIQPDDIILRLKSIQEIIKDQV